MLAISAAVIARIIRSGAAEPGTTRVAASFQRRRARNGRDPRRGDLADSEDRPPALLLRKIRLPPSR
jgi:hypothetical protein